MSLAGPCRAVVLFSRILSPEFLNPPGPSTWDVAASPWHRVQGCQPPDSGQRVHQTVSTSLRSSIHASRTEENAIAVPSLNTLCTKHLAARTSVSALAIAVRRSHLDKALTRGVDIFQWSRPPLALSLEHHFPLSVFPVVRVGRVPDDVQLISVVCRAHTI